MSTKIFAGVDMTALVSLLFIAMIPIDCKNYKFFLTLVCLLTIVIFGELTSATSEERIITMNIIFACATPINYQKVHIPVSFVFAYAHPVTQRYREH